MARDEDLPCITCGDFGAEKKCSACKMVNYCNQYCQKNNWGSHKKMCKELYGMFLAKKKMEEEEEAKKKEEEEQKKIKELQSNTEASGEEGSGDNKEGDEEK